MGLTLEDLLVRTELWFYKRNIPQEGTAVGQYEKTQEEVQELGEAIAEENIEGIKDGIGDVLVTLIGIALQYDLTLEECWEHAYREIKDRKGKMMDGKFYKEV